MAITQCPECGSNISTSAESCPNCGYVHNYFDPDESQVSPLSTPSKNIDKKITRLLFSALLIVAGVFCAFFFGIIGIIMGVCSFSYGVYIGVEAIKTNYSTQTGLCPYCGKRLVVKCGNTHFVCPICHNRGIQTENTLETNH